MRFTNAALLWIIVIIIGGIIIIWPPPPEPPCLVCGKFIFDYWAPIILVALGGFGLYNNQRAGVIQKG